MYIPDKYAQPRKCPVCGKLFILSSANIWTYKRKVKDNMLYFCTYSCMRRHDRERPKRGRYSEGDDEL